MSLSSGTWFGRLWEALRSRRLSRTIIGLAALALVLMVVVNLATFVMIRRTAEFNDTIEHSHLVRNTAKRLLIRLVDVETGQRGFLLTGRPEYLRVHDEALRELPDLHDRLVELTDGDSELAPRVERIWGLAVQRQDLAERTIGLARSGRSGEAVVLVRGGQGKELMDQMRAEIDEIEAFESARQEFRTRRSEWAAGVTMAVNLLAGVLILMLGGVVAWLARRHVEEINAAHEEVNLLNASLERKVRERTLDLSQANEEIQRFAYIVSHDLRAPLVNVMGYTSEIDQARLAVERQMDVLTRTHPELLDAQAEVAVREDLPEAVGFIRASTAKMDRLINAILRLSREGRRGLAPELIDMTAMVGAVADTVHHQVAEREARITVERLPSLESDRLALEQIFGNLVDNAVKYLQPDRPGRITVSGRETVAGVEYRVSDNGRGVSERDKERIFELFRRAGRQDQPGEGLGLAFVRNSVRRLGGSIEIDSTLGEGSTFVLKFPKRLYPEIAGDAA